MRNEIITLALILSTAWETRSFSPSHLRHRRETATSILSSSNSVAPEGAVVFSRRDIFQTSAACVILMLTRPTECMAAATAAAAQLAHDDNYSFQFQVDTSLPSGFSADALSRESTLVITVKPAVTYSDQVPKDVAEASLSRTGHWCPVVLKSRQRFRDIRFKDGDRAVSTTLTVRDLTSEAGNNLRWWDKLPLIVTAKLDSDGLATTFAPTDLVGCRIIPNTGGIVNQHVTIPLQRRGFCSDIFDSSKGNDQESQATYLPLI